MIFFFAIPLALIELLPDIGGKNPFWYFAIFVLGFILAADERFQQNIDRQRNIALGLALATMTIVIALSVSGIRFEHSRSPARHGIFSAISTPGSGSLHSRVSLIVG